MKPLQLISPEQLMTTSIDVRPHASTAGTERILAEVLAGIMRRESVDVNSHFFDDLGADSLVMAHFCARLRKRTDVPPVSMKDIYRLPTIARLAEALAAEVEPTTPAAGTERVLAQVLAGIMRRVSM